MKHPNTATARIAQMVLTRRYHPHVTLGDLRVFDERGSQILELKTVELPWKDNRTGESCIPEGTYPWAKVAYSVSLNYQHIHIKSVPGRTGIKIHVANYVQQLRGCIAPGFAHADINGDKIQDATQSRNALISLLNALPEEGTITINSIPV